jgi:drug/metabolite transporter (DMT)-like permease
VSILSSIQPVYGIILGVLFLNETPSITTLIGGVLILSTVVIEGVLSTKKSI